MRRQTPLFVINFRESRRSDKLLRIGEKVYRFSFQNILAYNLIAAISNSGVRGETYLSRHTILLKLTAEHGAGKRYVSVAAIAKVLNDQKG